MSLAYVLKEAIHLKFIEPIQLPMSNNIYVFEQVAHLEYSFISIGRRGAIKKLVTFEEIESGIYNVLLQDEVDGIKQGDNLVTDNGDAIKVINTTAAILKRFYNYLS